MRSLVLGLAIALALAGSSHAARCGSDVNGHGKTVPCDCGDVLVSSHTLSAADPITQHRCSEGGLRIDIPATVAGATLNLGGQVIAGGMRGIGLDVDAGGDGGVTITGPGIVGGFDTGIAARRGALKNIRAVSSVGNAADGFVLNGDGFTLEQSEGSHNGRNGVVAQGESFRVENTVANDNGRYGFMISGRDAVVGTEVGNQANGNGRDGFMIRGRRMTIAQPAAAGNVRQGMRTHVTRSEIRDADLVRNGAADEPAHGNRAPRCSRKGSCR